MNRVFAQPNHETFSMPPVGALLDRWLPGAKVVADPFARRARRGTITNDLDPATGADYCLDALSFAEHLRDHGTRLDAVLFDPPYSYRQCVEVYAGVGREWTKEDQQQVGRWSKVKDILAELVVPAGFVISFGWNTNGFGAVRGFEAREYLVVAHGSAHNDTLCTVEVKVVEQQRLVV